MSNEMYHILLLAGAFLALFALAEGGYYFLKIKAEATRKFVHMATGLLTLLFPVMLQSHWSVLLLCFSFFLLLSASFKFNFLNSINGIGRKSVGSLAYPVSVYVCYLVYCFFDRNYFYFYLPILILAISDPLAALAGKLVKKTKDRKEEKTIAGSIAFFSSAFLLAALLFLIYKNDKKIAEILLCSVVIAALATIAEAFAGKGWDNITIPVSVSIGITVLEYLI